MLSYDVTEWGKPLQKATRETPKPTGTEVLLRLKYCGVCHSDVHIHEGFSSSAAASVSICPSAA